MGMLAPTLRTKSDVLRSIGSQIEKCIADYKGHGDPSFCNGGEVVINRSDLTIELKEWFDRFNSKGIIDLYFYSEIDDGLVAWFQFNPRTIFGLPPTYESSLILEFHATEAIAFLKSGKDLDLYITSDEYRSGLSSNKAGVPK